VSEALEAGLVTDDATSLAAFYVDGMGFELESVRQFPQGDVHRLRRGEARLKLYQPSGGAATSEPKEPWFRDAGFAYAALLVDDADALVAQARAAGATVVVEVVSHRPGARFALLRDPQGNVWEVLEEQPAP
jgi:predicted enzyme related to lactoylglutathione lyase